VSCLLQVVTGPPSHSVGARLVTLADICRCRLLSYVTLHSRPAGDFTRAGQVMMPCRLQSNYSFTVTLHGRPVVLRPVRTTPCFKREPVGQMALVFYRQILFLSPNQQCLWHCSITS